MQIEGLEEVRFNLERGILNNGYGNWTALELGDGIYDFIGETIKESTEDLLP